MARTQFRCFSTRGMDYKSAKYRNKEVGGRVMKKHNCNTMLIEWAVFNESLLGWETYLAERVSVETRAL